MATQIIQHKYFFTHRNNVANSILGVYIEHQYSIIAIYNLASIRNVKAVNNAKIHLMNITIEYFSTCTRTSFPQHSNNNYMAYLYIQVKTQWPAR